MSQSMEVNLEETEEKLNTGKFFCLKPGCKKEGYKTAESLQVHISTDHNAKTTVMFNGHLTVFHRSKSTGNFHCPSDAYVAVSSKSFNKHCKACHTLEPAEEVEQTIETPRDGTPDVLEEVTRILTPLINTPLLQSPARCTQAAPSQDKDLQHANFLQSIGFRLNKAHKILICISCETAIAPTSIRGHLIHQHAIVQKNTAAKVKELVAYYDVYPTTSNVSVPAPGGPAVEGISVTKGIACKLCNYACTSLEVAKRHDRTHKSAEDYASCTVQAFFKTTGVVYFSVKKPKALPDDKYQQFMDQFAPLSETSIGKASTVREISQFLQKTLWHLYLEKWIENVKMRKQLLDVTKNASNKETWTINLSKGIQLYMLSTREIANSVDRIILRKMMQTNNSLDEDAWRVLQDDETLHKYGSTFAKLLITLLRCTFVAKIDFQFPLDTNQMTLADKLYQAALAGLALEEHIHAFSLSIFSRPPIEKRAQKWSCPLVCFLAVDNMRNDGTFNEAHHITSSLAQWEYVMRGVALFEAKNTADHYEDGIEDSIVKCRENILAIDKSCPFNSVFELQKLASSIAMSQVAPPSITWTEDFSSVAFKGKTVEMNNIREGLYEMERVAEATLDEVAQNKRIPYHIPDDLVDDMTDHTAGYSWLDNGHFTDSPNILLNDLLNSMEKNRTLALTREDGKLQLNHTEAHQILSRLAEVNQLLSVLLHIIPSQPSRGTEHVDTKIRNSWRLRNLFWQNGKLWIITQYTKTSNITGRDMFIPMVVPARLAKLLEYYLVVFRPLESLLAHALGYENATQIYQDYLYVEMGERVKAEKFSDTLGRLTKKYMKVKLTLNPYRHIAIAIKREFIPEIYHISSTHQDEVGDISSGHTTVIARRIYATQNGDLPSLTTDAMREFAQFCALWHNMMGFGTGPIPQAQKLQKPLIDSTGAFNADALRAMILPIVQSVMEKTIQSVIPEEMAKLVEAITSIVRDKMTPTVPPKRGAKRPREDTDTDDEQDSPKRPRQAESIAIDEPEPPIPSQLPPMPPSLPSTQQSLALTQRNTTLSEKRASAYDYEYGHGDAQSSLRGCFGDWSLRFKSPEQKELLERVLNRRDDVIAVLPTGGGKSVAFEVPATVPDGLQTVVIVPFKSLLRDILQRAKNNNIRAFWWNASKEWPSILHARLVLVIYETAISLAFQQCVESNIGSIGRLVYDECHQIYLAADLREKLWKFHRLSILPLPQIYLTATLPPHLVETFKAGLGLDPDTPVIRKTTERPEIQYCVLEFKPSDTSMYDIAVAKAAEYTKTFDKQSRGIIFSRSIEGSETIAKKMKCALSHAELNEDESQEHFGNWLNGHALWMSATSGFTNGIDYSNVKVVIFVQPPYGLTDFVQGSGRAGRSGQPSVALLITSWKNRKEDKEQDSVWKCKENMQTWIDNDKTCRRWEISLCMDGKGLTCRDILNAQLCDVCSGHRPQMPVLAMTKTQTYPASPTVRYVSPGYSDVTPALTPTKDQSTATNVAPCLKRAKTQQSVEDSKKELSNKLSGYIDPFANKYCITCFVLSGEKVPQDHAQLKECTRVVPEMGWKAFKKLVNLPRNYTYCFHCWTPQEPEPPGHIAQYSKGKGTPCNWHSLLCLCAWTVFNDKKLRNLCERKYKWKKEMTLEWFGEWIIKERRVDKFNNGIDLFLFINKVYDRKADN